jgi:hypothetical protein
MRNGTMLLACSWSVLLLASSVVSCVGESNPTTTKEENLNVTLSYILDPFPCSNPVTTCNFGTNMHCCPNGQAMQGISVAHNLFRCVTLSPAVNDDASRCFVDSGTVRDGMHACPVGSYMKGFDQSGNKLTCCTAPTNNPLTSEELNGPNQKQDNSAGAVCPMQVFSYHTCDVSGGPGSEWVMGGINVGSNTFICDK